MLKKDWNNAYKSQTWNSGISCGAGVRLHNSSSHWKTSSPQHQVTLKTVWHSPRVFGYTPETTIPLGANLFTLFKHKGSDSLTRTSYADVLAIVTLNKQLVLEQNDTLFTRGEKYLLNGLTGFSKFPQYYYGIGNAENGTKDIISYNQFRDSRFCF